jgi:AAA ATPase domain
MNSRPPVNPYIAGAPVTGAEMFYGRDDVFAFVQRNLIGRHRDSPILLYGQRRTGKTSVLYQLHRQLGRGYRCIFIDLHGLDLTGMGNFLLDIASSVSRGLQREHQIAVPVPDDETLLANPRSVFETVFLDAVWSALGEDHLVLMMDEVIRLEEEVRAGRMESEVFNYLRHLMQHHARLNFIFSLGSGLEDMKKDYAFLFSVALYHRISFLDPAAARDLITEPVREHYQVAPQAVTKIIQVTSGHPYYTQLVCHCLFDLWSRSPKPVTTEADVDAVLSDAIELGSANLTYVWEDSTPEEQAVMAGMAAAMGGEAREVTLDDVRRSWQSAGVVLPARDGARALRSLAGREVVTGKQAYAFTVDLQRLWLEQHRRLEWVKEELGPLPVP